MKIAVVSHAIDTHSGSRAPIMLATHLAKLKNSVYLFAYADLSVKKVVKELKTANVNVILINSPKIRLLGKFLGALKLTQEIRKVKPDVISTQATLPFVIGAKLSGYPVVITHMGTQFNIWLDKLFPSEPSALDKIINNFLNILIKFSLQIQMMLANHVITFTKYCSKETSALYGRKSPFVFWGGAPKSMLDFKSKSKAKNEFRLLSVSRIVPYKGFHTIIKSIKELENKYPQLRLTIIGSHPNKKYLSYLKRIKSKNTKIIINASDKTLAENYQSSSAYVTADKYLFFGMPIFEAASFKLCSVAYNFASANEVILNNKTGFVVSNEQEFKKAITKLIRSAKHTNKLGNNAYKFVSKHTWDKTAFFYLKQFKKWQKK